MAQVPLNPVSRIGYVFVLVKHALLVVPFPNTPIWSPTLQSIAIAPLSRTSPTIERVLSPVKSSCVPMTVISLAVPV